MGANFRISLGLRRLKSIRTTWPSDLQRSPPLATFAEFAKRNLAARVHEACIINHHSDRLIGHISRDATAIEGREKVTRKETLRAPETSEKRKRGRPKKGEKKPTYPLTRLERQLCMTLTEMLDDLPKLCDIGTKVNVRGFKVSWKGYKFHVDTADNDIPISTLLTSASLHDSQVGIPLATITAGRVTSCYDLMDAAYDAEIIRNHSLALGHAPLIDFNRRSPKDERAFAPHEAKHYTERSAAERVNSNLNDNFGGRFIFVKGHTKVYSHLMFGVLALAVLQTIRLVT